MAGATRPVGGGAYSSPRSEPGGQNTPRAGRVVASYGTYTSALGLFAQQVDQGSIADDAGNADLVASGSGIESFDYADARTATATASGTGSESSSHTEARTATVTASGTGTESSSYVDTRTATATATGSSTESHLPLPAYSVVVLADGPVAYWRGSIPVPPTIDLQLVDQTGRGNYLRLWHNSGAEAAYPKDAPSLITNDAANPAMDFIPDSNAWRDAGSQGPDFSPSPSLSLELWCKPRAFAVSGSTQHDLARKGSYWGLTIEYQGGNYVFAGQAADGANSVVRYVYGTAPVVANTTYHVVFTLDATNLRLYVDGTLVATQLLVGTFLTGVNVENFALGQWFQTANGYDGILDEVALYNYALTSTQVQTHHDAGIAAGSDATAPIPTVTVVDVTKISRVVGKDAVSVTFTTDEAFVEYEIRRVSSGSDPRGAGDQVETAVVSSRTSHLAVITDDELISAAASEGSNTLKIFVKDLAGNWST